MALPYFCISEEMTLKLSILIPTLKARKLKLERLMRILRDQITPDCEILLEVDGGEASIGRKRNALVRRATGEYVCFVDDDDTVSADYIQCMMEGIDKGVDVVSIRGRFSENGIDLGEFIDKPYQQHSISQIAGKQTFLRGVQHLDAVKRELAISVEFPDSSYTEDYAWGTAMERSKIVKTFHEIDHPVYFYDYWNNKPDSRYICNLAIVMPVYNHVYTTMRTVESLIANTTDPNFRLIFIDDCSTIESEVQDYASDLAKRLDYRFQYIRNPENKGVNASWNIGVATARAFGANHIAIVNNDLLFAPNWDVPLMAALKDSTVGIVSPLSTHGFIPLDWPKGAGRDVNPAGYRGYMPLLGACFAGTSETFGKIGPFPESMKIYFGDNWLALACQAAGLQCGYEQESYIHHMFCITTSKLDNGPIWEREGPEFDRIEREFGFHMIPFAPPPEGYPAIRPNPAEDEKKLKEMAGVVLA